MESAIEIQNIHKSYGNKKIFSDFSLSIGEGDIVSIVGPNGCGKTTLMNILAGIVSEDSGFVRLKSKDISYIFQNYRDSLLPWKNNYENAMFPLEIKGCDSKDMRKRVEELENIFGVDMIWNEYPYNLSGGQQQILAFFRALLAEPKIILIDEAFSALDFENNLLLRNILQKYYVEKRPTIVMITHNIEEAVHIGNKIVILSKCSVCEPEMIKHNHTYPRNVEYLMTDDFHETKDKVLASFREKANYDI